MKMKRCWIKIEKSIGHVFQNMCQIFDIFCLCWYHDHYMKKCRFTLWNKRIQKNGIAKFRKKLVQFYSFHVGLKYEMFMVEHERIMMCLDRILLLSEYLKYNRDYQNNNAKFWKFWFVLSCVIMENLVMGYKYLEKTLFLFDNHFDLDFGGKNICSNLWLHFAYSQDMYLIQNVFSFFLIMDSNCIKYNVIRYFLDFTCLKKNKILEIYLCCKHFSIKTCETKMTQI